MEFDIEKFKNTQRWIIIGQWDKAGRTESIRDAAIAKGYHVTDRVVRDQAVFCSANQLDELEKAVK